jgi:hypothetical protein
VQQRETGGAEEALFKPVSVWCFEPVCESGRMLFLEQRSVAFMPQGVESTRRNI